MFSLTWPASTQIYWNKRKQLNKKRVELPQDWFGTPTWPPFHCFGTSIWPPWRHVKTLCWPLTITGIRSPHWVVCGNFNDSDKLVNKPCSQNYDWSVRLTHGKRIIPMGYLHMNDITARPHYRNSATNDIFGTYFKTFFSVTANLVWANIFSQSSQALSLCNSNAFYWKPVFFVKVLRLILDLSLTFNDFSYTMQYNMNRKKPLGLFWLFRPSTAEITIRYT